MRKRDFDTVFYLAVLPSYRQRCIDILLHRRPNTRLYCSPAHLDQSVKTGIRPDQFSPVQMIRLGGRIFFQLGGIRAALAAGVTVVDLNPRSVTSWFLLCARRLSRRRTLVWGHLYPQAGHESRTAALRRAMRRLATGTISYTYRNRSDALEEMPDRPVWVAPNALYTQNELADSPTSDAPRTHLLYVGRLEHAKKVDLLIRGFSRSQALHAGASLTIVGDGSERSHLEELAESLGLGSAVRFSGWVQDLDSLRTFYSHAFASASPGFAGLGLTQSLGFGVQMIVSRSEPHSPEIELADTGGVTWARSGDEEDWSEKIDLEWNARRAPDERLRQQVLNRYTADSMAAGLVSAIDAEASVSIGR